MDLDLWGMMGMKKFSIMDADESNDEKAAASASCEPSPLPHAQNSRVVELQCIPASQCTVVCQVRYLAADSATAEIS